MSIEQSEPNEQPDEQPDTNEYGDPIRPVNKSLEPVEGYDGNIDPRDRDDLTLPPPDPSKPDGEDPPIHAKPHVSEQDVGQCWATHPSGLRCDRKAGHDGKNHRFQWADQESFGYTTAAPLTSSAGVSQVTMAPAPHLAVVPPQPGGGAVCALCKQAEATDGAYCADCAVTVAMAERPLPQRSKTCMVCQHEHTGECPRADCGCLNAIVG